MIGRGWLESEEYLALVRKLWRDQNGLCKWCGKPMALKDTNLDHIIPRSLGGSSRVRNLVATHRRCNKRKGSRLDPEHLAAAHPEEIKALRAREALGRERKKAIDESRGGMS
jgi:5-methylcytosine-specific restriction endonuclease McrA